MLAGTEVGEVWRVLRYSASASSNLPSRTICYPCRMNSGSCGWLLILAKWAEGNSLDPIILLAGTLLLSLVSGISCAIPARHASEVDPMTAQRCE
jgi:hypothetical protein